MTERKAKVLKPGQPHVGDKISFRLIPLVIGAAPAPAPIVEGMVVTVPSDLRNGFYGVDLDVTTVPDLHPDAVETIQYVGRREILGLLPLDWSRTSVEAWLAD